MSKLPRHLPNIYLGGKAKAEPFVSRGRGPDHPLPRRDRETHALKLRSELQNALAAALLQRTATAPGIGSGGFYLDFQLPAGSEHIAERLENRNQRIELARLKGGTATSPAVATVYVPIRAANYFNRKVEEYRTKNSSRVPRRNNPAINEEDLVGRPKNEDLVARIERVSLAAVKSLFTDQDELLPRPGQSIWWEVWTRKGELNEFLRTCTAIGIEVQPQSLSFPDRDISILFGDEIEIAQLFVNSSAIAELRRAKDTPVAFIGRPNGEQRVRAQDLLDGIVVHEEPLVSVCLLDTGVTREHPLLSRSIAEEDVHVSNTAWARADLHGHGTNMAGIAIYGDLVTHLESTDPCHIVHCLESAKILPDNGANEPRLYGAITAEAVARAEVSAPYRKRVVCMAVTSDSDVANGRPSSWSSQIDQMCFGDERVRRLVLISAGNVRGNLRAADYPFRNETESIEDPAQAWNAITVGAFTNKNNIVDPAFAGWEPVAPSGDLCPTSRTSLTWSRHWPIKPDLVMEGGNWASDGEQCDAIDDLGLITTFRDPAIRHFDIFRDTSAATAAAANLAARIYATNRRRWPETVRALMIHSAEWSPAMRQYLDSARSESQRLSVLRKFGFGVPDFDRAVLSAANDMTLIAEDTLRPLFKEKGRIKSREMNLHEFPWPRLQLEELGASEVELRVTLSYYIEPNPGDRGWVRRHSYPSYGLRFEVKKTLESLAEFRRRINAAAAVEEMGVNAVPRIAEPDNWLLKRGRNSGSVHSDIWRGTAADLAKKSAIGVFPVGGWWKENPSQARYENVVRYALIVSIKAVNGDIDIYTPVTTQIASLMTVET